MYTPLLTIILHETIIVNLNLNMRIDGATSLMVVTKNAPSNQFFYTVAVFSASLESIPITVTTSLDETQLDVLDLSATNGTWQNLTWWSELASQDHPATLYLHARVRPGAAYGATTIHSTAVDAHGAVAASGDVVQVCCQPASDVTWLARKTFLPMALQAKKSIPRLYISLIP